MAASVLELNSGPLDTADPRHLRQTSLLKVSGRGLHLVQFPGSIRPEWRAGLASSGVRIVSYLPNNGYLVYGEAGSIELIERGRLDRAPTQWSGPYLPTHKIHRAINAAQGAYSVQLVEDDGPNDVTLALARSLSHEAVRTWHALGYVNLVIRAGGEAVQPLADRPDVVSILPYSTPRLLDERQDMILAGQLIGTSPAGPGYLDWLAAKGFTQQQFDASAFGIDITDSGIDNGTSAPNHFGLYVGGDVGGQSRVVYEHLEGLQTASHRTEDCNGHGTINAHIAAGYGRAGAPFVDELGYQYGLGVAPFARLGASRIFDPYDFTYPVYEDLQSRSYAAGMRISSNSWGAGNTYYYDPDAQRFDALVRDAAPAGSAIAEAGNQEMVIIFAAGNNGPAAVTSPALAKNVISVGASENVRPFGAPDRCGTGDDAADSALDVASFSSRGIGSGDPRFKPDLIAPGTHIVGGAPQSAEQLSPTPGNPTGSKLACFFGAGVCGGTSNAFFPANQQWYTASTGTSHATPAVAGAAALLRQWFLNQGSPPPSPAMTRAYLMNSARYATGAGGNLPSNDQGMGLLDLGAAFNGIPRLLRDQAAEDLFTATGQTRVFEGTADPAKPFRVTLAWTDAAGPTFASPWVNDLNLTVEIGGLTFLGNVFSGPHSVTGGRADSRNNVESVFLPPGIGGPFKVTVTAANIAGDGVPNNGIPLDQDFALVVMNSCNSATPVAPPGVVVSSNAPNSVTVTWSADASSHYLVERAPNQAGVFTRVASVSAPPFTDPGLSGGTAYWYRVRAVSGCATSPASAPQSATPDGSCLSRPIFQGVRTAAETGLAMCGATLSWDAAQPACGGTISYDVFRGTDADFIPASANRVATLAGTSYLDAGDLVAGTRYWYIVRAVETVSGHSVQDDNTLAPSIVPAWKEVLFEDDFDARRPANPGSHWLTQSDGPEPQLSIVSGCNWQSPSSVYKFGARGSCGGGYDFGWSLLNLVADATAPLNGFFIPPDAKASLRFRHWYRFHPCDGVGDGARLLYQTPESNGLFYVVLEEWALHYPYGPPYGPAPFLPTGSGMHCAYNGARVWGDSDRQPNGNLHEIAVNVDQMANQVVSFAWLFGAEAPASEEGYYLDDVRIELQRPCSTSPVPDGGPARFRIDGLPASATPGVSLPFTATALDAAGQPMTGFNGTGKVRSSDAFAAFAPLLSFSGGAAQGTIQFATAGAIALEVLDDRGLSRGVALTQVSDAPPARIRFLQQPSSGPRDMNRLVEVAVENEFGAPVRSTTLTLSTGTNASNLPWNPVRVAISKGRGLANVQFLAGGKGYTLVARAGDAAATTDPFDVFPSQVASMALTFTSSLVSACQSPSLLATVVFKDAGGSASPPTGLGPFKLELVSLRGPQLLSTSSATEQVQLEFPLFAVEGAEADLILRVTDGAGYLAPVLSQPFTAVAASAARMILDRQSSSATASLPFAIPLAVTFWDACGNATADLSPGKVTASLAANPAKGVLLGTTAIVAKNGVARFDDLAISLAGTGYRITLAAPGLPDLVAAPIDVSPGPPAAIFISSLGETIIAGKSVDFLATVQDQAGDSLHYVGSAALSTTDSAAQAPASVAFAPGEARFSVVFASPGKQTISLDTQGDQLKGRLAIDVYPVPATMKKFGGCATGGAGVTEALALLALVIALNRGGSRRVRTPPPAGTATAGRPWAGA